MATLVTTVALGGLVAVPASAAPSVSTWTSGANDGLWSSPANWDVPPEPGNDLVFPGIAQGETIHNDLPSADYGAVSIDGQNLIIAGNAFGASSVTVTAPGSSTIAVPLVLQGQGSVSVADGSSIGLAAPVYGSAGMVKTGNGTLVLSAANSFSGPTTVQDGQLRIQHSASLGASDPGSEQTLVMEGASLVTQGNLTLQEQVSLAGSGHGGGGALRNTAGRLLLDQVTLSADVTITTVRADAVTGVGYIGDAGLSRVLTTNGAGRFVTDHAAHTGGTIVAGGRFDVGSVMDGPATVLSGAVLGGGSLARVTSAGTVTASVQGTPTVAQAQSLSLGSTSGLLAQYDRSAPGQDGLGASRLDVQGDVVLGGAALTVRVGVGYQPASGDVLGVLRVGGQRTGTFAGLPEGGVVRPSGTQVPFRISYAGGDGNDVTLTAVTDTTTSLAASPSPSVQDQAVTLTATVTPSTATGTVTFNDGSTTLGTAALENGQAVLRTTGLAVGSRSLTAAYGGDAGHLPSVSGAVSHQVEADTTAPDTTIDSGPADGSVRASGAAVITFSSAASDVASFRCRLDGGAPITCINPVSISGLPDGQHSFEVWAVDRNGNADPTPSKRTWTVDTTAPGTTITEGPADGSLSRAGEEYFAFSSPDADVVSFECSSDGAPYLPCPNGFATLPAFDGERTFEVRAIDRAGNVDPSPEKRTWTSDTTPPETTLTAGPVDASSSDSDSATFTFTSPSADAASFRCYVDLVEHEDCTSPMVLTGLADGEHTFSVQALDRAGNPDMSAERRTWTVDTTSPDTSITTGPAEGSSAPDRSATLGFSSPDGDAVSFACKLDDGDYAPCTSPATFGDLSVGTHTVEVRAIDRAGNVDQTPAARSWTVKPAAPTPTEPTRPGVPAPTQVSAPQVTQDGKVYQGTRPGGLALSGRGVPGAVLTVRDGAKVVARATVRRDGRWSATTSPLGAGRHVLTATQTVGGRTSAPVRVATLTVERLAVTIVKKKLVTSTTRPLLRGRGNAGARVVVRSATGKVVGRTTVARDGTWRLRTKKLALGRQTVRATQTIAGTTTTSGRTMVVVVQKR